MNFASIQSAYLDGITAKRATVEADVRESKQYHFTLVGLPDKSIDESEERIIAALRNSKLPTPTGSDHSVTISLAPASEKKEGSHFDAPIAIAYLCAIGHIKRDLKDTMIFGELSLEGNIMPMRGALPISTLAKSLGIKSIFVPTFNAKESALVDGIDVYACDSLSCIVSHLRGEEILTKCGVTELSSVAASFHADMRDIRGQEGAKRALLIAAAGGHNISLYGPPGTGKSMLAKAFTSIMPKLSRDQALEVASLYSVSSGSGQFHPFARMRSPHHTSSFVSLVGGGNNPRPGEISLAHRGVLFLDELPLFENRAIEALREPLQEGYVTVSRAKGTYTFPARTTLVCAMNPCPCGYYGSSTKQCVCDPGARSRYAKKLSGPIMDRIDMWIPVTTVSYSELGQSEGGTSSETLRNIAERASGVAMQRNLALTGLSVKNSEIPASHIALVIPKDEGVVSLLEQMAKKAELSGRAYHRIIRVARTISDLKGEEEISRDAIMEAFGYRPKL